VEQRQLGTLWPVSALALGGGGLGQVWGTTTRAEAVATVRRAVDAGITLLDMAPSYGAKGEAEAVIGEAFAGSLPSGVHVTTKHMLGNPPPAEVYDRISASLDASLERMRLARDDIFILHGTIDPAAPAGASTRVSAATFAGAVIPAFQRLMDEGRIGAWGITGVGIPSAIIETFAATEAPAVAEIITNFLDSPGSMRRFDEAPRPRDIIRAARANGVGVLGIRAVQAGALTSALDRELEPDHPERRDFDRAAPFRRLAAELGATPAALAHRYALSMDGVNSVVLGVKNRAELDECLAAEAAGPLAARTIAAIDSRAG
jgi:aryl-alcohol dehydrogenase-like predicted oxidoreductase